MSVTSTRACLQVFGPGCSLVEAEEDEGPPPAIMVYLVDPFSVGHDHPEMHRFITLGLLRCYKQMLDCLPPHMQANVHVQVSLRNATDLETCGIRWSVYGMQQTLKPAACAGQFTECSNLETCGMRRSVYGMQQTLKPAACAGQFTECNRP